MDRVFADHNLPAISDAELDAFAEQLCSSLPEDTHHLLTTKVFSSMKPSAVLAAVGFFEHADHASHRGVDAALPGTTR
jgi:hypothetical protein